MVVEKGDQKIGRDELTAVLGVIPARGGSKRIVRKNIRPLCGEPMLAYTVEAALTSGVFARVVVSTDSETIADVARSCGADVPFIRDSTLADDHTHVSAVTLDALERLAPDASQCQAVAQLMPNCPLRTATDIRSSFEQFEAIHANAQLSVTRFGWQNPWWAMKRDEADKLQPVFEQYANHRSQDLPELFCPTGAIWWIRAAVLRREKTFHVAGRTGWEIPWQHGIDIDTQADWELAEQIMTTRQQGTLAV